jgi:hypothetical protein
VPLGCDDDRHRSPTRIVPPRTTSAFARELVAEAADDVAKDSGFTCGESGSITA